MEKTAIEDVFPVERDDVEQRRLSDALGTTDVAINRYVVDPGQRVSGLHAHVDQEEVFVVLRGEATFETLDGEVTVEADETIRFPPKEFQSAKNDSNEDLVLLALGAPQGTEDIRVPVSCPACGHEDTRPELSGESVVLACPDCGTEADVECPGCGGENLEAVLSADGSQPVNLCLDCGHRSPAR